jgi:hypothetical protein
MWLAVAVAGGLAVAWMPAQPGLSRTAQLVLAITAFSALSWALQVMSNGITAVLMMALLILAGVRPPLALSGFSGGPFWVLLPVLFYGFAMRKTGLAERLSYFLWSSMPDEAIARRRPDGMLSRTITVTTETGLVKATASPSKATSAISVPTVPPQTDVGSPWVSTPTLGERRIGALTVMRGVKHVWVP